jgi:hypothetical protein
VINEDLNESIKSNTGRNTPNQTPQTPKDSIRVQSDQKKSIEKVEKVEIKIEPIEVMEMEHDGEIVPEEEEVLIKNIFKENEEEQ